MSDVDNVDPYAIVLADLYAQRDRIAVAIAALEGLRGGASTTSRPQSQPATSAPESASQGLGPGAFLGMSIVDAAKKLLAHERRQMNNADLVEGLKRGGLALNSAEPLNTVGSVLNRRYYQVGDVVRVARGTWGLKEWYPNRSFKAKATATDPTQASEEHGGDDVSDLIGSADEASERVPTVEELLG